MNEIFKLFGRVVIEGVDEAERDVNDLTDTVETSENKFVSAFKKIGAAVVAAFAVDKIISFGQELASVAAEVAAEESAFAQIMGDYADEASEKMSQIAKATGKVDSALTPYMTSMTAKFKGLGFGIEEATDYAQRGLYLASDASAFWDMSLDESMSHLNSFINGSYEGGEAIGLFANDTQMAAYAVESGIVSCTKEWAKLDEKTKQATRMQYAENMMKLSGAVGQASKEADQYANVSANLSEKWRQLKAELGEPILQNIVTPAMAKLSKLIDKVSAGYKKASKWVKENGDKIQKWTGYITAAGVGVGTFLIYLNWGQIMGAAAAALNLVTASVKKLNTTMASNPIGLVLSLITSLIAYLVYLYNTNEEFRAFADEMLGELWAKLQVVFAWLQENALPILQEVIAWIQENVIPVIKEIFTWIQENALPMLQELFAWIQENILPVLQGIMTWINENVMPVIDALIGWLFEKIGAFWAWLTESSDSTGSTLGEIWEKIKGFFSSAWEFIVSIWEACQPFFDGIWNGIVLPIWGLLQEMIGAFQYAWDCIVLIWDYVQPYFSGIWEGIKAVFSVVGTILGMHFKNAWEAIKLVWGVVVEYFKLVWEGIKAVFSVVWAVLSGFFRVAWEAIKAIWNNVISYFTLVWAGIKAIFAVVKGVLSGDFSDAWDAIKNVWEKAKAFFDTVWTGVKNVFGSVGTFFKDTFNAAWNGVKKVFSGFTTFFKNLWSKIKDTFSKIGTNIGDAIGKSVTSGINGIIGMIEGTINSGIKTINGAINLINEIPGVNINKLKEVEFPRLAKGGIVTRRTFAEIGENGAEAIVPLERNTEWIDRVAQRVVSFSQAQSGGHNDERIIGKLDELIERIVEMGVGKSEETMNAILDGIERIISALLAGHTIKLNEREVARTVREYA